MVAFARQFFLPGPGASIGHGQMVVMNADGTGEHVVRPCDHGQCTTGLSWSPDEKHLAYIYRDAVGVMDADGKHDRFVYQCRLDRAGCIGCACGGGRNSTWEFRVQSSEFRVQSERNTIKRL